MLRFPKRRFNRQANERRELVRYPDEGFSAYKGEHMKKGALGVFAAAVQNKDEKILAEVDVMVVENLDRISRQGPKIARGIIAQIVDNGVQIDIVNIAVKLTYGWENDWRRYPVDAELERGWQESVRKSNLCGEAWAEKGEKPTLNF